MPETGIVKLRPRDREQVEAFADLHEVTLPDSVPVHFGRRFMTDFYFKKLPEAGLVAGDLFLHEGRYVGYNFYTKYPDSFLMRGVRQNLAFLLWFMPLVFLRNPGALLAIPPMLKNQGGFPEEPLTGYWLTFGVHPDARRLRVDGKTVGALLIERMIEYFRDEGFRAVEGTVDRANSPAKILYRTCGFTLEDRGFGKGSKLQARREVTADTPAAPA